MEENKETRVRIAVTSGSFSRNKELVAKLEELSTDLVLNSKGKRFTQAELKQFLKGADAVILGLDHMNDEILQACPELKIISKFGVGIDNIDFKAAEARDIRIGWTPGVNRLSVAEMTLCFMLGLIRNMFQTSYLLSKGEWKKQGGFQLSEKKIGIIGVGNIGREVVRLLAPFNCRIMVNDIIDISDFCSKNGLEEKTKPEIYKEADIISLHVPMTELTNNLIDKEVLSTMKRAAFLINTSRGGVVNEKDLGWALENGEITGAAIDVYQTEPPTDVGFLCLPNLVCTPHIGGNAYEAVMSMGESAIGHIKEFFGK